MATEPLDQSPISRLESIYAEVRVLQTEIIEHLPRLPSDAELMARLHRRCDELALELDALRAELHESIKVSATIEVRNAKPPEEFSGLKG